jgi:Ca-activated chloride channel family protein
MIRLANPFFLFIGVIFLLLLLKRKTAFLGYSHLPLLEAYRESTFPRNLPRVLSVMTIVLLVLGLGRPQWQRTIKHETFLARDILLIMDLSYSMELKMENTSDPNSSPRKIDASKMAALRFIEKRKNDRIGLLVFGDETFGSWPLTRDLGLVAKKVERLGSTFYGGTNLAKPLVKAMVHFREMGQSASRVVVFLSDGQAKIPPPMKETIIQEVKKMGIHLYLLGIELKKNGNDLLDIVDQAQGRFIDSESASELTAAFDEIDRLEPSMIEIEVQGENQELYPLFLFLSLGLMVALALLHNTLFIKLC